MEQRAVPHLPSPRVRGEGCEAREADEGRAKNNIELAARFEQARIDIQKGSWDKPDNTFRSSMARQLLHVPCERQDLFGSRFEPIYSTYSRPLAETELPAEEFMRREVDPILDKINAHGLQSLTPRERQTLERARERIARD